VDIRSSNPETMNVTLFSGNDGWGTAGIGSMRIVFLCFSLEPGRDGVGDYTRALAGELIRPGHEVCAVAMLKNRAAGPAE
jgi:hypothetical protein